VLEALRAGAARQLFIGEDAAPGDDEVIALAGELGVPAMVVSSRVLGALSDAATPQGVVGVVDAPTGRLEDIPSRATLVLVLAGVRDPGNAGTLVRTAVAAGADAVVFARGSVDALNPKTVRAAAGALQAVPVIRDRELEECVQTLRKLDLAVVAADARAGTTTDDADLVRPLALVLGNEAWGIPSELRELMDGFVAISMAGGVDSLNVAIAGSIILFEVARQRRAAAPPGPERSSTRP
jgi:TrmH family RNA methyltransferase